MGMANVHLWPKRNRKGSHRSPVWPRYCRLFLEALEDRSMLSITPVGMTDFNALLHFPSLGNGWEIVGTAGGVVELVNVAEVGRLQPVPSLTTSASIAANGTFMYPINQTAGTPLFPRL